MVGEVLAGMGDGRSFPFAVWARSARFKYPPGVTYPGVTTARADGLTLELQVRAANYWVDAVVADSRSSLAIEIDGIAFHHRSKEQIAADYIRQRRIVLVGHTVIRFTAQEALGNPNECWRQIGAILAKRAKL